MDDKSLAELLIQPAPVSAPGLLGCLLSANGVVIRLTEVEAYAGSGGDPASHAYRGRTRRNEAMFGPPGTLYMYFTYGMHWCANVCCEPIGTASAILLRAGEVVSGVELATARRRGVLPRDLARGPARLVEALGLGRAANGTSVLDGHGPLTLFAPDRATCGLVRSGPRVGIAVAADRPWRFWLDGEPTVSAYRRSPRAPARTTD